MPLMLILTHEEDLVVENQEGRSLAGSQIYPPVLVLIPVLGVLHLYVKLHKT